MRGLWWNGSEESIEPIVAQCKQARTGFEARPGSYAARNTGIELARGDILAFTDADCLPAADWIEHGLAALQRVENCGLGGRGKSR
jgi:glycosyltransferase involved in cell wall biosynthesis